MTPATNRLVSAWLNPGPRPDIHRKAQAKLEEEWPVLYYAIQAILQENNYQLTRNGN